MEGCPWKTILLVWIGSVRFDIRYNECMGHSTVRQLRIRWSISVYVVLDAIFYDPERTESIFPTRYRGQNEPFGMS